MFNVKKGRKKRIILICAGGGHFNEIMQLEEMFVKYDYLLITERTPLMSAFKDSYNICFLKPRPMGKKRRLLFFISVVINFYQSMKLLFKHYPKVIITTGGPTAAPMCLLGKLLGVKIVFILSYARINSKALTADIVYPVVDKFIIQWQDVKHYYAKGIFLGGIY